MRSAQLTRVAAPRAPGPAPCAPPAGAAHAHRRAAAAAAATPATAPPTLDVAIAGAGPAGLAAAVRAARCRRRCRHRRCLGPAPAPRGPRPPRAPHPTNAPLPPLPLPAPLQVALRRANPSLKVRVFERGAMAARGAAILVGVNGLKALDAIDPALLERLLSKAIRLEGSGAWGYGGAAARAAVRLGRRPT
jgi:hypothetical protein